jgi:hypothetical protein
MIRLNLRPVSESMYLQHLTTLRHHLDPLHPEEPHLPGPL